MSDTKIQIKSKAISTIVDSELSARLFHNKGTRVMAIVELVSDTTHENQAGDRGVDLLLDNIELCTADGKTGDVADEHVRTLMAAFYRNRMLAQGNDEQLPIDELDGPTPALKDVVAQGNGLVEKDTDGNTTGLFSHDKPDGQLQPV